MMKKIFSSIVDKIKQLWKRKQTEPGIAETPKATIYSLNDFVAIDTKQDRVCVRGRKDKFTAVKVKGKWKKGYPEFDDLMDYFTEVKVMAKIEKLSMEARTSINFSSN